MANPIKYSTTQVANTIKKGNSVFGVGNNGFGTTEQTGFWTGVDQPTGGYAVYVNTNGISGPRIYIADDNSLPGLVNQLGASGITTLSGALEWIDIQSDIICVNREYEGIITDGLIYNVDAGFIPSYCRSGTSWRDLSGNNKICSLINGPSFNLDGDGTIAFDGTNDYGQFNTKSFQGLNDFTFSCVFKNIFSSYTYYGGPIYTEHTTGAGTNNTVGFWIGEPDSSASNTPFRLAFWFQVSNSLQKTYSSSTIEVNRTVDVSFVREGNQAKIYIDGNLDVSATRATGALDVRSNNPLVANVGYGARFGGNIYLLKAYNRALSSTEVLQNFNATKSRFGL